MKKLVVLFIVVGILFSSSISIASESVLIIDDSNLKYLASANYTLEGTVPFGKTVKVNGIDAKMFQRFETSIPLIPAPSFTPVIIEVLDKNKNLAESQTLDIENYKRTETLFYMSGNVMTVNGITTAIEVRPQIVGSIVYIPFSYVCEAFFGESSAWDEETQTETFSGSGYKVRLPLDSKVFYVNGEEKKYFECEPVRVMGETLVPFWLPEDVFGCDAYWRKHSKTIYLEKEFHPKKDFDEQTPSIPSLIEFVKLEESFLNKEKFKIKGNIPNGYDVRVDGQDIKTSGRFRIVINIIEQPSDNPIFIEVFDENDELIESKNADLTNNDELLMMTWMFEENMLIRWKVKSYDVVPYIINGSTMVPLEAVIEAFDIESVYMEDSRTYIMGNEFVKIELPLDEDYFLVDGVKCEWYSPLATIVNDKVSVYLRPIAEALGFCVEWIGAERIVKVTK